MTSQEFCEGTVAPYKAVESVTINTTRRPTGKYSSENQTLSMNKAPTLN